MFIVIISNLKIEFISEMSGKVSGKLFDDMIGGGLVFIDFFWCADAVVVWDICKRCVEGWFVLFIFFEVYFDNDRG